MAGEEERLTLEEVRADPLGALEGEELELPPDDAPPVAVRGRGQLGRRGPGHGALRRGLLLRDPGPPFGAHARPASLAADHLERRSRPRVRQRVAAGPPLDRGSCRPGATNHDPAAARSPGPGPSTPARAGGAVAGGPSSSATARRGAGSHPPRRTRRGRSPRGPSPWRDRIQIHPSSATAHTFSRTLTSAYCALASAGSASRSTTACSGERCIDLGNEIATWGVQHPPC